MGTRRIPRIPVVATLALSCVCMIGLAPQLALGEVKTFSEGDQLSRDTYSALGLQTTDLDENAAKETAPFSMNNRTTIMSHLDTYVAANGNTANTYTIRRNLNRLDDEERNTGVEDDWGRMVGAYQFFKTGVNRDHNSDGHQIGSDLSDNEHDVAKGATNNGFSGRYATSVAMNMGNGWNDHVAELRAYGDDTKTDGLGGGIAIKIMKLDSNGDRTEVASLDPVNDEYLISQVNDNGHLLYLDTGYNQELDALFEIEAADVDDDGVDELFAYTGAYVDRNGERYAVVDMYDYQDFLETWKHSTTELDAGPASSFVTTKQISDAAKAHEDNKFHQWAKRAPVVTFAAGNLDREGGEELAMTVSAPANHAAPAQAGCCYLYTWDASNNRLTGIDGLNKEIGGDYIPLSASSSEAMVSANCAFGTFEAASGQTTLGLILAGWDCVGSNDIDDDIRYTNAGYRYVYYDPASDSFKVSGYKTKALGKDASKIVESATEDADEDQRYVPTFAPFALSCARLQGMHQTVENDQVLFGGEVYDFTVENGLGGYLKSISMCSNQQNENSNTKGKEQVWIGDVVSGSVNGSDMYEESFLAVIGVHRDEDLGDSDDYYWMDVAHFTANYSGDKLQGYRTAQEGVVCEGPHTHNRYGTWVSLCLPNISHRSVITQYVDMAKYYSSPQALAMLEDAPYYQDLQDSYHYIVLGGTGFGRSRSTADGSTFTVNAEAGAYVNLRRDKKIKFEIGGEFKGHFDYETQDAQTLSYNVSYDSHAGEGNKVVAYAIPVVDYYYKVLDLGENPDADPNDPNSWGDLIVPVFQEPVTSVVSAETWDAHAAEWGGPKTTDVFANQSGDPSTYTPGAMAKYPGSTRAFTSESRTQVNNSQGATITQEISTENEEETTIGGGPSVALHVGGGGEAFGNEIIGGAVFSGSLGWCDISSNSNALDFTGAIDNVPEEADEYGFSWKLAVNKSDPKMKDEPEIVDDDADDEEKNGKPDSNQFWIVGYEVENATPSSLERNAVSGLTVTGATDHSVTLAWNGTLDKGGRYNYGLAMVNGNGTLSDWEVVPAGTTSYTWGETTRRLSPSTEYRFVIAPVTGDTKATAKRSGIRSAVLSASTLPEGDVLTTSGLDIVEPQMGGHNAKVPDGNKLTMRETATYLTHDAQGNEVYAAPTFTWYRVEPHSSKATLVGAGEDGDGNKFATSKDAIDTYLSASPKLSTDATPHTSSFTLDKVTPSDDGSVWYCNVSYNNALVQSQQVNLDVTNAVETLGSPQAVSHMRQRSTVLKARNGAGFTEAKGSALKGVEAGKTTARKLPVAVGKTARTKFSGTMGKVTVKSSNPKVAKASFKDGRVVVRGLRAGKATVTATSAYNGARMVVNVTVSKRPNTLNVATSVKCGKSKVVRIVGAKGKVTVRSLDPKVAKATYKAGRKGGAIVIKGVKNGQTSIKVTAKGTRTFAKTTKTIKVSVRR